MSKLSEPALSIYPGEDDLPCSDGVPMETERHVRQMTLLISSLELAWQDRRDFYVGGNMFVYFSERQIRRNDFRGPDVFVALDVERRERKSWVAWKEGKTPDVVIELLSETTQHVDRGEKKVIYAREMRVPYYFLFDPFSAELEGYRLDFDARSYRFVARDAKGDLPCPILGLSLGVRPGIYAGTEAPWLRWIDAEGAILPDPTEKAEAESRRAEAESRRAEAESRRAEAEASRAEDIAKKLAEYERRFGPLPD